MEDKSKNVLCEEFCDEHKLQAVCLNRMKEDLKTEFVKVENLTEELRRVERDAHRRMDNIGKEVTLELKETMHDLKTMVADLKKELGGKLNGTTSKFEDVEIRLQENFKKEMNKKVPFWAFYVLLVVFLGSIGGLYTWQWDMSRDNTDWQKCVIKDFNNNMEKIARSVENISNTVIRNTVIIDISASDIRKHEEEVSKWREEVDKRLLRLDKSQNF